MSPPEKPDNALLESLTKIVVVYLERNSLPPEEVPGFIDSVFKVLLRTPDAVGADVMPPAAVTAPKPAQPQLVAPMPPEPRRPAVPIEQSVTPDYLICLEDGAKLKLLKRYLQTQHNLTPRQYRERWGLPKDYPMVAPSHSARRAEVAKAIGLGTRRTSATSFEPVATSPVVVPATEPAVQRAPGRRRTAAASSAISPAAAQKGSGRGRRARGKSTQ